VALSSQKVIDHAMIITRCSSLFRKYFRHCFDTGKSAEKYSLNILSLENWGDSIHVI